MTDSSSDLSRTGIWNGHYACACYHPLFALNQFGDLEAARRVPATSTAPMAGTMCASPSWRASASQPASALPEMLIAARTSPHLASAFQASRKSANILLSLGVIWDPSFTTANAAESAGCAASIIATCMAT
jgi:hypothetical protein